MTVSFADGEAGREVVTVPIVHDGRRARQDGQPHAVAARRLRGAGHADQRRADDPRRRGRAPPPSFTIGGTVTGLAGTGLVLQD